MNHASFYTLILNEQNESVLHSSKSNLHMSGSYRLKCSHCPYETLSSRTPFFYVWLFPSPWVTVARLQHRPVGPCKLRLERLAVWVTAPLPTLSYKGVLTTLVLLYSPQNTPQPPIWLFAEKERTKLGKLWSRRGFLEGGHQVWAPVGNVVSAWTRIKEKRWFLLPCRM